MNIEEKAFSECERSVEIEILRCNQGVVSEEELGFVV